MIDHFIPSTCSAVVATADGRLFIELLPWLGALLVLVLIGAVAIYAARRMMQGSEPTSEEDGFTLHSLRELHKAGKLSNEEFALAKEAMIGSVRGPSKADEDDQKTAETDADSADNPDKPST
jgi:hypothetical protein